MDNGGEFAGRALDAWAYWHQVKLDFIRPGKPVENGFIESFNGKLGDECLNSEVFLSIADAREKLEHWRHDYNHLRPHSSLANSASGRVCQGAVRQPKTDRLTALKPRPAVSNQTGQVKRHQSRLNWCPFFRGKPNTNNSVCVIGKTP